MTNTKSKTIFKNTKVQYFAIQKIQTNTQLLNK